MTSWKATPCTATSGEASPSNRGLTPRRSGSTRAGRSVAAIHCDTSTAGKGWCRFASATSTRIDIDNTWCLLELLDLKWKAHCEKKAAWGDFDFHSSWDERTIELRALGAGRKICAEGKHVDADSTDVLFSDCLAGKTSTPGPPSNRLWWTVAQRSGNDTTEMMAEAPRPSELPCSFHY